MEEEVDPLVRLVAGFHLGYLIVMVRKLQVHSPSVDVSSGTKDLAVVKKEREKERERERNISTTSTGMILISALLL